MDVDQLVLFLRETNECLSRSSTTVAETIAEKTLTRPTKAPTGRILLRKDEIELATEVATRRFNNHRARNTPQKYGRVQSSTDGSVGRDLTEEIRALGAELAAARVTDRPWVDHPDSTVDRVEGDLGEGIGVRFTPIRYGNLMVYPEDPDWHFQICTRWGWVEDEFAYDFLGWFPVREARRYGPAKRSRPGHLVPVRDLFGMNVPIVR